jgi:transcriptional regulator with XRE-family HTH domain
MGASVGEYIRHQRNQQGLTQTQLGGETYSKSYISAIERNKILPSRAALRFFAEQLNQPAETLEQLSAGSEKMYLSGTSLQGEISDESDQEIIALLDLVLQGKEPGAFSLYSGLANGKEAIGTGFRHFHSSVQKQARYMFLHGLIAQKRGELIKAREDLEYALALVPGEYRPTVLDALGTNAHLQRIYQSALWYHKRALHQLQGGDNNLDLLLRVEYHCGEDYQALGAYHLACHHYERARSLLCSTHNLQMAAKLYFGLGYCLYISLFQRNIFQRGDVEPDLRPEGVEGISQRAQGFLVQSRGLYQVSTDKEGESLTRLAQAALALDFSFWHVRNPGETIPNSDRRSIVASKCQSSLDEAEEQCRQVLHLWLEDKQENSTPGEGETILYTALAFLVRVFKQRATLARLSGYTDTSYKERIIAAVLSQEILDALPRQSVPWTLAQMALHLSGKDLVYQSPALPRLPDLSLLKERDPASLVEICFAAAEVAEELGQAGTTESFIHSCYEQANRCFLMAFRAARQLWTLGETERVSLLRAYQRCLIYFEERLQARSGSHEESLPLLLTCLKEIQDLLQCPLLAEEPPVEVGVVS